MTTYVAVFYTNVGSAEELVKARTPAQALAKARRLYTVRPELLFFDPYESEVEEIVIHDQAKGDVARWQSDDLALRLAASDLLEAVEFAVQALNTAPRFPVPHLDTDSYAIASICDRAIAKAKGGAA